MKKLRRVIVALAIVGAGFFGLFATQENTAAAESCISGTKYTDFDGTYSGRDTMTVWTKGNKLLCNDVNVNFSSFTINNTYNGQGFKNNPTALPQTLFYNKTVTLKKGTTGKTTVTVSVPDPCKDFQIDAYIGPVQHKITTNEGLVGTNAIVGKVFQRFKADCSPKMVKVCDPATGKIISVPEADADKYKPVGDVACKPVKVCDPSTGKIIVVKPGDADNYKPVGDAACQDITVCRLSDHTIVTIKSAYYDSSKYSKNLDDCKPPTPNKVHVCDPATGNIIEVDEADASKYKPAGDVACQSVSVCDPSSGQIITVKQAVTDNYKPVDDEACQGHVEGETTVVSSTPTTVVQETPTEIASTGPEQAVSALFGAGSLAGASTAYIRSRRALRK